ncbi:MAG: hypothetical protein WBE89_18020, partial [Methyloceanibacter sp.]
GLYGALHQWSHRPNHRRRNRFPGDTIQCASYPLNENGYVLPLIQSGNYDRDFGNSRDRRPALDRRATKLKVHLGTDYADPVWFGFT